MSDHTFSPSACLELMSWPEAETALGTLPIAILPLGARTKEHGPHLPLNNDWLIAEYLARRTAERCPALMLPTLQYGFYPAFLEYPGSVSLKAETFRDTVLSICRSLSRHGMQRFYVLNTGISTIGPLTRAGELLTNEGLVFEFTNPARDFFELRRSVETQAVGTHADEIETSMMLYIAPEVVRMDLAPSDMNQETKPGGLTRDPEAACGVYSPTGVYGNATLATLEKGRLVVEGMVEHIASTIHSLCRETPPQ